MKLGVVDAPKSIPIISVLHRCRNQNTVFIMVLCSKTYIHNITKATNSFIFNVKFFTKSITVFSIISVVLPSTDKLLKVLLGFHELSDGKRIESSTEINLTDFLFEVSDDPDKNNWNYLIVRKIILLLIEPTL